jgi:hypothetical protein
MLPACQPGAPKKKPSRTAYGYIVLRPATTFVYEQRTLLCYKSYIALISLLCTAVHMLGIISLRLPSLAAPHPTDIKFIILHIRLAKRPKKGENKKLFVKKPDEK